MIDNVETGGHIFKVTYSRKGIQKGKKTERNPCGSLPPHKFIHCAFQEYHKEICTYIWIDDAHMYLSKCVRTFLGYIDRYTIAWLKAWIDTPIPGDGDKCNFAFMNAMRPSSE